MVVTVGGQILSAAGQLEVRRACSMQVVVDPFLWQQLLTQAEQFTQLPQEAARIARYDFRVFGTIIVKRSLRNRP
jgi:hypothetical protein